jgi:hypothetical protein
MPGARGVSSVASVHQYACIRSFRRQAYRHLSPARNSTGQCSSLIDSLRSRSMGMGFRIVLAVIDWSVQFLAEPISFTNSFRFF